MVGMAEGRKPGDAPFWIFDHEPMETQMSEALSVALQQRRHAWVLIGCTVE